MPTVIATPSRQVGLTPEDLARLRDSGPPETVGEWLDREAQHFYRHEAHVTSPAAKAEDLLYLTERDVEKFRDDQLRDERGRWMSEGGPQGGVSTVAAARAHGWRPTDRQGVLELPGSEDELHVSADGSWYRSGPFEDDPSLTLPTVARGDSPADLVRHMGGEAEQIPPESRDLVGARPLDERDVVVSPEMARWLEEVERDPDMVRARELTRTGTPTSELYADAAGNYTPERAAMHRQIAEEMLKPGAARRAGQQKTAILMIGPSGAGKTTTLGLVLRKPDHFSVIAADYAKERMPGYDGYNAALLHEESTVIADKVAFKLAVQRGHNIVLDATGKTSSKYEQMAEDLARLGYNVQALHVDVPTEVSARRAYNRFKSMKAAGQPPRYSDPRRILYDTDAKPTVTYENLKRKGLLSRAMEFNSNGPPGSAPKKVEDIDYRRPPPAAA